MSNRELWNIDALYALAMNKEKLSVVYVKYLICLTEQQCSGYEATKKNAINLGSQNFKSNTAALFVACSINVLATTIV